MGESDRTIFDESIPENAGGSPSIVEDFYGKVGQARSHVTERGSKAFPRRLLWVILLIFRMVFRMTRTILLESDD